ncbi:MAG: radical SAM family heme chaperone HemW, partial [Prevotella sp.]|nr:radical SAM family heme chaperone HemW [Prevotella sp.]
GSVYLGGGTPSVLTEEQLCRIFESIERNYIYNNVYSLPSLQSGGGPEITLECNPDDVTDEFCATLRQLPVNRISMGAQTFDDARLKFLRRRHSSRQIAEAVNKLRHAGIENISIDLMFGFPGETLEDWEKDIERALRLNVEHISAYALMYEEETALFELWKSGKIAKIDEELMRKMYYRLIDRLENAGFEHYEISNFAKRGFRSRHNSSYWNETPYVGLGAAAHSYDGKTRSWNASDIEAYIAAIERGELPSESEEIDIDTRYNDLITSALRTREGIHLPSLSEKHRKYLLENAQNALRNGFLAIDGDRIHLTRNALFISDSILSDLILV